MSKRALLVGRFQPFHYGHLHAVKHILKQVDEIVIGIGSAQYANSSRNPLSADERYEMIVRALRAEGVALSRISIVPIPDIEGEGQHWGELVLERIPRVDLAFSNDPETVKDLSSVGIEVEPIPFLRREVYAARKIRELMLEGNEDWRELVPKSVASFLDEIDMEDRVRDMARRQEGSLAAQKGPERTQPCRPEH